MERPRRKLLCRLFGCREIQYISREWVHLECKRCGTVCRVRRDIWDYCKKLGEYYQLLIKKDWKERGL